MKIKCPCGHLIPDSTDNLPQKAHFITDKTWFRYQEEDKKGFLSDFPHRLMYQCYLCGRLALNDSQHRLHFFAPEDPKSPLNIFSN